MPSIGMAQTTPGVVEMPFDFQQDTTDHDGNTVAAAYMRLEFDFS